MTTGSRSILRRDLLLGSAAGALLLAPFLRRRALQAQAALPRRLVLVFTPDSHPREWWPATTAAAPGFELRGPLLDFAGLESHMLFVRRVDHSWTFDNHHEAGVAQLFTGQRFFNESTHYANGPSIDQVLLDNTDIRGGTPLADIHLCVADDGGGGDKRHVCCYSGPGQPIPREPNPARAFANIFQGVTFEGGATTGSVSPNRRAILERTLALNTAELRKIQTFLGREERERLELHVESLRELERATRASSTAAAARTAACAQVDTTGVDRSDRDDEAIRAWSKVQVDLLVSALCCDRTRVAELGFGFSGSHHVGMMGLTSDNRSWHDVVAHASLSDDRREGTVMLADGSLSIREAFIRFDRLWASQVAYLARRLSEIPEGDGSMLDNTLIYWGVESGTDHNHSPHDLQYLLIGGRKLGLATGRFLQLPGAVSAHQLHTSVLHAFGYTTARGFGIEPDCGPLGGVLG